MRSTAVIGGLGINDIVNVYSYSKFIYEIFFFSVLSNSSDGINGVFMPLCKVKLKFLRSVKGYSKTDKVSNEDIKTKLRRFSLNQNREKKKERNPRLNGNRTPKHDMTYKV